MQKIITGIQNINTVIADCKKVLLVCDSSFPFLTIKKEIEDIPVPYIVFNQFTPNPLYVDVCKGVELFNKEQCDSIIAVGGGSSLDVAKCIKLYCKMPKDELYLEQEYKDTCVKLIAIPTTAGTGSESTRFAVIYYDGKKQSVTHNSIIPDVAILEPKVLKTLPLYQKKSTMLDALCQGIESWWSINSTEVSRKLSRQAVETIMKWWREYIFDNSDESAENIMKAANSAGQAICITQTTAPHAFSYKITSLYGIPHGHAVAICLPEIWEFMTTHMEKCIDKRGTSFLSSIFMAISEAMGCNDSAESIALFRRMMKELDMQNPVALKKEDFDVLVYSVNPIRLKNNPISLDYPSISSIYNCIIKQ